MKKTISSNTLTCQKIVQQILLSFWDKNTYTTLLIPEIFLPKPDFHLYKWEKKSFLHGLIKTYTFINFQEIWRLHKMILNDIWQVRGVDALVVQYSKVVWCPTWSKNLGQSLMYRHYILRNRFFQSKNYLFHVRKLLSRMDF